MLKLNRMITRATRLILNSKKDDFRWGDYGVVYPGEVNIVPAIGNQKPESGKVWFRDYGGRCWEVSDEQLQAAQEPNEEEKI